jgi:ketosteroid isomerase-like protein
MSGSNVEVVREVLRRFNDDRESLYELLAEDFVVEIPASLSAEPDVYEGHAGARRYLEGFEGQLEDVRFVPLAIHDLGEQVIVELVLTGRGAASGIEVEMRSAVVHWIEDGKVRRILPCPDLEAAHEALRSPG